MTFTRNQVQLTRPPQGRFFINVKTMKHRQLLLATVLVSFGVLLISAAFIIPPTGVIDPTVLTAFGEILTFAGAIIGIDYRHRDR